MTLPAIESRLRGAVDALPKGLRDHVLRVEIEATIYAKLHGVDEGRARLAALGHDLLRHEPDARLLVLSENYGYDADEIEHASPILLHGPLAAKLLARNGYTDPEVLAAVDCHTTARAGMSTLEKVLLIADKVEPEKLERRPALEEVRVLAARDLDGALLRFIDLHLAEAAERRWLVHPRTIEARNELLLQAPRRH